MEQRSFYSRLNRVAGIVGAIAGIPLFVGLAVVVVAAVKGESVTGLIFGGELIGWGLVGFLLSIVIFALAGIQERLARIEATLGQRADGNEGEPSAKDIKT